jgi:glutamate-1-semialdehyde aminotransferase
VAGRRGPAARGVRAAAPSAPAPPRERAALALPRSTAAARRTAAVVPGGSQTYQKRASLYGAPDGFPGVLDRGRGAVVWDLDGQHYVDFVCGLGTTTLGHAHPAVVNTVRERVGRGVSFSLPTAVEGLVAELLTRTVPGAERVRFFKTGAESCSAALRLARARTGRDEVLLVGYHGWHDGLGARGAGTPAAVAGLGRRVDLDDPADDERLLDRVRTDGDRLAAVLFAAPYHRRVPGDVVAALRAETARRGALLVMDEIVTAFRLAPGGVSELTGVRPDLVCLSKGLAAGMPLAALVGTADAMAGMGDLHVSTTFGGEVLSLYVARAALGVYAGTDYYDRIAALGRRLREGVNTAARRRGLDDVVTGHDPMPFLVPPPGAGGRAGFSAALAARGHLVRSGVNFLNAAHTPDQVDALVDAVAATLDEPATA